MTYIQLNQKKQLELTINEMLKYTNYAHGYMMAEHYNAAKESLDKAKIYLDDLKKIDHKMFKTFGKYFYHTVAEYDMKVNK